MPTINNRRQINIGDVTGFEFIVTGDSVANHIVDADATALGVCSGVSGITQASWNMPVVNGVLVNNLVQLTCGDTWFDTGPDKIKQLSVETTCCPHHVTIFFGEPNSCVSSNHNWS